MKNFKLGTKLLVFFLAVGIIPFAVMGFLALFESSQALKNSAFNQLVSIREIKGSAVKRYFESIENQIVTFSEDRMIVQAMQQFAQYFPAVKTHLKLDQAKSEKIRNSVAAYYKDQFGAEFRKQNQGRDPKAEEIVPKLDQDSLVMQYLYISTNKNPLGSKDELVAAEDGSDYSKLHKLVHPVIRNYLKKFGYYDIFLVEPKHGDIVYSVFKELDYSTSLLDGPYAKTNFGECFRLALEAGKSGKADAVVLVDYKRYGPSYDAPAGFIASPIIDKGQLLGVAMFQMPIDRLNAIMNERAGMGKTGETYLVGPDKLMRSDSFLDPKNHSVKASFADPSKGRVNTKASRLALSGKTDQQIIIDYNGNPVLSAFTPIKVGDLTWGLLAEIDESEAFAPVTAMEYMLVIIALVGTAAIIVVSLLIGRSISKPINRVVQGLTDGAEQVASAANQVSSASQSLAGGSSQQAASLEETSASIEELASMSSQNNDNAQQADSLMKEAGTIVANANSSMKQLKEAMGKITKASEETGKIIRTIDEIAFQTNLLALNAAVEAARAGEAGAGFAVVADEVRNLAMRAAEAAKNTSNLIEENIKNIQEGSDLVINTDEAFSQVEDSAKKVAELIGEIAAASREQTQGIGQINKATDEMDTVTQQVAANAEETAAASEELSAQAETMHGIVEQLHKLVEGAQANTSGSNGYELKRRKGNDTKSKSLAYHDRSSKNAHKTENPDKDFSTDEDF